MQLAALGANSVNPNFCNTLLNGFWDIKLYKADQISLNFFSIQDMMSTFTAVLRSNYPAALSNRFIRVLSTKVTVILMAKKLEAVSCTADLEIGFINCILYQIQ